MERLEPKVINGRTYYYYSHWGRVNGKCRRIWQKYLGTLDKIVQSVQGQGPSPLHAEVFQWGLPMALWKECGVAEVIAQVDKLCPKRSQGLSTGQYLAIAAINRAICPCSKRSMWEWFCQTVLLRHFPQASPKALTSQRFWDHMDRIKGDVPLTVWKRILQGVVMREKIDISSISYDGTNFYTFIDTFNVRCEIGKRGKNKQGRNNLRQVSYALFCSADGHIPLFYDVYEGNRNDAKQFPLMLQRFGGLFRELSGVKGSTPNTTLIFDKGNNSPTNFGLLDSMGLNFVGSVKLDEHKELARISNHDARFVECQAPGLEGVKAFRVTKKAYGRDRDLVVTYSHNLFNAQWRTLQNDIGDATEKLSLLRQRLEDRVSGVISGGKTPTVASIEKQCKAILHRQYMKQVIPFTVTKGADDIPRLEYEIDTEAIHGLCDTYLGKNILITSRKEWDDVKVIQAYRSQFIIEDVFKEMKDRTEGSWWPLCHWTDSKIRVHGLYCTIALLLRALLLRRVTQAGVSLSLKRTLSELDGIREVTNIYPRRRGQKTHPTQTVISKTSELQRRLMSILEIKPETGVLG